MKRYGLHWKWKYKVILYGYYDGDDREYYVLHKVYVNKPTQKTLDRLMKGYSDNYRGYDGYILKTTSINELTVYDAYSF